MERVTEPMILDTTGVRIAEAIEHIAYNGDLGRNLAAEYSAAVVHNVGEFCMHEGSFYKCIVATPAGAAFSLDNWEQTLVGNEIIAGGGTGAVESVNGKTGVVTLRADDIGIASSRVSAINTRAAIDELADEKQDKIDKVGVIVEKADGSFEGKALKEAVDKTNTNEQVPTAKAVYDADKTTRDMVAPEWSAGPAYAKDALVLHDDKLYKAKADIVAGSAWDATKWELTTIAANTSNVNLADNDDIDDIIDAIYGG